MPAPVQDIIITPTLAPFDIALEPAFNAIHSLLLIAKSESTSGFGQWVTRTAASMSKSEHERHRLVMIGFFFAVTPRQSWPSFSDYIDHLATMEPMDLRDKLLDSYINLPCLDSSQLEPVDKDDILASADTFLTFLNQRFHPENIDTKLETAAYSYIVDPPALRSLIVSHLQTMWDRYLSDEWGKVLPMLQDAVTAFEHIDYGKMTRFEIASFITGQDLDEDHWQPFLEKVDRLVFVPSAHAGPYIGKFKFGDGMTIVFGARLPEGAHIDAPDLSRAEILVRLSALADDTRLAILRLIGESGEMRSQEIMRRLSLSQSATSRHLKQLSATGYLRERRCEGAKCYEVNEERIEDTLAAVSAFLIG